MLKAIFFTDIIELHNVFSSAKAKVTIKISAFVKVCIKIVNTSFSIQMVALLKDIA